MSDVKIEAFFSDSNDSNDTCLRNLLHEIKQEYGDRIEIVTCQGQKELFDEYCLTANPALVIEEMIKIMGFCPSKETLISSLREAGLE